MKRERGLPNYPGSRMLYASLIGLITLEAITLIAQATFLARAITNAFERDTNDILIQNISLFVTFFILRFLISYVEKLLAERFALRTTSQLRMKLVSAYFKANRQFIQQTGTAKLVTLAAEGIEQLRIYLEMIGIRTFRAIIVPMLIAIYVFTIDKVSAGILVLTVPLIIIFMILLGLAAQKLADKQYATYKLLANHFVDSLKGLETLAFLGQSKRHAKKISKVSKQYREATVKTLRVAFLSSFALNFFTSLSIAFVAVGLGFRLIDGEMVLLPALTILILAPEYFLPIKQVGSDYHATLDGQIAKQEIDTIILENTNYQLNKEPITKVNKIKLNNVQLQIDGHLLLNHINLNITQNGLIGIIGASGAGKSTLIQLLAGLVEQTDGEILINGEKTTLLNHPSWLEKIAYIPQNPYIFPLTLADNIRFYAPSKSDQDVIKVAIQLGLGSLIEELPNGIHEIIGEGGRMLSGGQEQRVALARALLSNKQILLLDEPTAHLDIETEYELKEIMLEIFKERLVLFATHRLHWMKSMDALLILKDGELVAQGHHQTLMKENDLYQQFIAEQGGKRL